MTPAQRRLMHARDKVRAVHLDPITELLETTAALVRDAEARVETAEQMLEEMRPVWAQGFTSDSEAAQECSNALAEIWHLLGVDNQTEAMSRLRSMISES